MNQLFNLIIISYQRPYPGHSPLMTDGRLEKVQEVGI